MFYHALTGNGGTEDLSPVLLWENSNPTAEFAAQTISLDLTDYAGVIVEFNESDVMQNLAGRLYCKKTDNYSRYVGVGYSANVQSNVAAYARNIIKVDNNGVEFGTSVTNSAANNQKILIPIKIYGVKKYIVEPQIGDLLWHNDNPTASLSSTNAAGDYSKYSKIYVEAKATKTNDYKLTAIIEKNNTYKPGLAFGTTYRTMSFTASNIKIDNAIFVNNQSIASADNNNIIVTDIYGIV